MATYYRWVPKEHAQAAFSAGLVSHNGSAMWVFGMGAGQSYRPGQNIYRNAWLLAFDIGANATKNMTTHKLFDFEDDSFAGEAAHPDHNIVKENEPGAFGIGRNRQKTTNLPRHTTTRWATRDEVAKALGISKMEVEQKYRPGKSWP